MTTLFLSDADVWRCVCAARLIELDRKAGSLTPSVCDAIAATLSDQSPQNGAEDAAEAFYKHHSAVA